MPPQATTLTFGLLAVLVAVSLVLVFRTRPRPMSLSAYYVEGRQQGAAGNGLALFAAYTLVTSLMAMSGEIALSGYDGALFATSFAIAWLVALLIVAEPLRNTSKFTFGDLLSVRMQERPVRIAAGLVTLIIFCFYMLFQMVATGKLAAMALGAQTTSGQVMAIAVVGALTTLCVLIGGMRGATCLQLVKSVVLLALVAVMTLLVLGRFGFNISALLGEAVANSGEAGAGLLAPGGKFGAPGGKLEFVSQLITVVLGHAALPYIFMRFNTVRTSKEARRSVSLTIWLIGIYYLCVMVLGFGAAAIVGHEGIMSSPGERDGAAVLLALELGGVPLVVVLSAVLFVMVFAVTAGLMMSAVSAFTHDVYRNVAGGGVEDPRAELRVARKATIAIGVLAVLISGAVLEQNISFLLSLDVTIAASAILPTIVYMMFWGRFNTSGAVWSIYGGMAITVLLVALSPAVSGSPRALLPDSDFALVPWRYVGIISIPVGFLLGYIGTILSDEEDAEAYAEMEVRALTGAGAEQPTAT